MPTNHHLLMLLLMYSKQTHNLNPKLILTSSIFFEDVPKGSFLSGFVNFLEQLCLQSTDECKSSHRSSYSFLPCSFKDWCMWIL